MLYTNRKLGDFAKDPAVIRFNGIYYLYCSVRHRENGRFGIGIAESADMENWTEIGEIPATQECEKNGIAAPAATVLNGAVHLFYQTYGNGRNDAICHAVSTNGVDFEQDETNPVFHPTDDWCCGRAIDADVAVFNGRLMLYFATRDHGMNVQKIGCASAPLSSSFSRNDFTQTVAGPILSPELKWEQTCIEAPAAIENDGNLYMFYGGAYNCSPQQIGCAVSSDGIHFDRLSDRPFYTNGPEGSWNSSESGHPYAFRDDDGKTYLFFQGSSDCGQTWYISRMEIAFDACGIPYIVRVSDEPTIITALSDEI